VFFFWQKNGSQNSISTKSGEGSDNKSSAVAEMGDHLATINNGQKVGAAVVPFCGGAVSPSNSVTEAEAYLSTKWHLDPSNCLATIRQHYRQTGQDSGSAAKMLKNDKTIPFSIFHFVPECLNILREKWDISGAQKKL